MAKSDNGELNQSDLQSDNSDPNNSIFKKVTKRVSASLAKWFGPSGEGQSVIRRRESVEEDDEALQIHQPPKKRARPNVELDGFAMTSTPLGGGLSGSNSLLSRDLHLQTPGPSGFKRYLPVPSATVVNGDDKSDSGDSTSGYSSVLAQQHKEPSFVSDRGALIQPGTSAKSSPCPSKTLNTSLNSTRSLFSSESLNPKRQCLSSRRPSFNASTFGSPSFVDRTLSTKRAVNSPFYSGRTTFGGASAYRRNRFLTNNLPVKSSVSIKPVNDGASTSTAENVSLSKTARRILETLEHFNTPVLDARKIPNINRQNCDLSKTRKTPYARDLNTARPGPSNRELLIPSVPDLLKMKQKERLQDSTVQVRNMAVNSKSVLNTEYTLPSLITVPNNEEPTQKQHTNKMKSKITSSVREKKTQIDVDYILEPVPLPDIKLPITSLPKFDFAVAPPPSVTTLPTLPVSKSPIIKDLPQRSPKSSPKTPQKVLEYLKGLEYNFNFSKPLVLASDIPKSISSINNFKFSDPIDAKANIAAVSTLITFKESTGGSTAPRKKNNGQQSITSSPVVSLLQPASKLVEGSVMDILGKDDKNDDKKPWECSNCLVRNMYCDSKCHACQTLRENVKKVEKKPISGLTGFGNKFKMEADKWECSACMVRNSNNDDKCAACTTPKPGATNNKSVKSSVNPPVIASTSKSSFGNWGDKFKTPSDMWECTTCMIRNKAGIVKCIACETPKPGSNSKSAPVTGTGNKALIIPSTKSGGFGDLIKMQQSDWECSSCMVRNPPEKKSCVCCEAPKPGEAQQVVLAKPPAPCQFKFGLDKVSSNALASTSTNASNGGFKFGAAADVVDNSTPVTFSFGVSPASSKPVSSPGFSFGIPVATTTVPIKIEAIGTSSSSATFSFETPTVVSKPTTNSLNFGVVTSTSTTVIKPVSSNIFGTTDKKVDSTPSVAVSSTTTISAPTLSAAKNAAPQFNFAPFMPKTETVKASPQIEDKPSEPTAPRPAEGLPSFGAFKSTMFNVPGHALAPPGTISFANADAAKLFSSGFAKAKAKPAGLHHFISVSKEPVFNFASGTGKPVTSNLFSFGANKPTTAAPKNVVAPTFALSTPSTFGSQQPAAPQNGGFNFGAPASKPSFNFGASPAVNTPSTASMFGFGASQSQAGTGSLPAATGGVAPAPAPAAPASGVFTFGGPASAFPVEPKPNNLFNTGVFTAPSSSTSSAGPSQRRIRKAIRRTQPRMSGQWPPTD